MALFKKPRQAATAPQAATPQQGPPTGPLAGDAVESLARDGGGPEEVADHVRRLRDGYESPEAPAAILHRQAQDILCGRPARSQAEILAAAGQVGRPQVGRHRRPGTGTLPGGPGGGQRTPRRRPGAAPVLAAGQDADALGHGLLARRRVAEDEAAGTRVADPVRCHAVHATPARAAAATMVASSSSGGSQATRCSPAPVDRAHPAQVAVELAARDQVGQRELLERGGAPVGRDLGRRHVGHWWDGVRITASAPDPASRSARIPPVGHGAADPVQVGGDGRAQLRHAAARQVAEQVVRRGSQRPADRAQPGRPGEAGHVGAAVAEVDPRQGLAAQAEPGHRRRRCRSPGRDLGVTARVAGQIPLGRELAVGLDPLFLGWATAGSLLFRPAATVQLELAGTLALNTGTVILTYRIPS